MMATDSSHNQTSSNNDDNMNVAIDATHSSNPFVNNNNNNNEEHNVTNSHAQETSNNRQQQTLHQQPRVFQLIIPSPQPLPQIQIKPNSLKDKQILPPHLSSEDPRDEIKNNNVIDQNLVPSFPSEFECPICYEVISKPTFCGSCDARYCKSCILKNIHSSLSFPIEGSNLKLLLDKDHKCPICRNIILNKTLDVDPILQSKIYDYEKYKPCLYAKYGCKVLCKTINCRLHEQTCYYQVYKCKYSVYGCTFQHRKWNLDLHYQGGGYIKNNSSGNGDKSKKWIEGCYYSKLHPIIQGQHTQSIYNKHFHAMLQSKFVSERVTLMASLKQLLSFDIKALNNNLDMWHCIYLSTCHTKLFIWKSLIWQQFWNCDMTRCIVFNYISLVPSITWLVKTGLFGVKLGWEWIGRIDSGVMMSMLDGGDKDIKSSNDVLLLLNCILSILTIVLGITFLLCFVSTTYMDMQYAGNKNRLIFYFLFHSF